MVTSRDGVKNYRYFKNYINFVCLSTRVIATTATANIELKRAKNTSKLNICLTVLVFSEAAKNLA